MAKVLVTESYLEDIADEIRTKLITQDTYKPSEMAAAIAQIGGATLITKSITENGTYNAVDDSANGYSSVTVNVGGSGYIEEWDLTDSLTGQERNWPLTTGGVVIGNDGAVFDSTGDYLRFPFPLKGITIELDIKSMSLQSGDHRRFVMGDISNGFIYKSNGKWAFYSNSWTESNETDGSFFDNCTMKINIDMNGYWHIYKDDVLWWEPSLTLTPTIMMIGSSDGKAINNAIISAIRIS